MTNTSRLWEEVESRVRTIVGSGEHRLHTPSTSLKEAQYVKRALDNSAVSVDYHLNQELVDRLSKLADGPGPVLVSSGTAALHLALLSVGVSPGSVVICPALSFVATANAILYCGAEPKFLDVEEHTLGLSPNRVRDFLENARANDENFGPGHPEFPSALLAVSVFGLVPKLDELEAISKAFGIPLVIDAAGAFGSSVGGNSILYRGDVAITSFNGNKIVTSGSGGAIFSKNEKFLSKSQHLALVAKKSHDFEFIHDDLGYNYRMPAISAALLLDQLENFSHILERKRRLHVLYREAFQGLPLAVFDELQGTKSNYWLNSAQIPSNHLASSICGYLNSNGLGVRPLWKPLPTLKHLEKFGEGDSFPIATKLYKTTLSFPSSYHLIP